MSTAITSTLAGSRATIASELNSPNSRPSTSSGGLSQAPRTKLSARIGVDAATSIDSPPGRAVAAIPAVAGMVSGPWESQ